VEFQRARELKIPLIARAEALAEIMRFRRGIAVGGTHGKTTTTSLVASVFLNAQLDPTVVIGGRLDLIKSTAQLGQGEWLIAEADESDGSFHRLSPENIVVTNIDNDHLDYYKTFENIKKAFYDFALRIPFYGTAVVCGDDPQVRELFTHFPKRVLFYGFGEGNDYRLIEQGAMQYQIWLHENFLGMVTMPMPGRHNSLNALAAFVLGQVAGITPEICIEGIEKFAGVDRRFQWKASRNGIDHYDDYGHHPTEVKAVMAAMRERFPGRRLVVIFQPHRYSRSKDCWQDFLDSFLGVDKLFVLDIYPAGEKPIEGVTAERFCQEVKCKDAHYLADKETATQEVLDFLQEGDVCLTLGAGDVWRVGESLYA
jgi:UDP-N-acetylmuramate--alanine ligase